ncbi:recombinase family protein [Sphingomonas aurantiaca]|uniref:recombinase family protein n=1 Tax=Sphingomonas aurantiaca TaxID=185949 RepID=UPI002FE1B6B7
MPRCAIYARFSSDRQSQTSADDQVADCRARAEREGWEVVQVYADLAISGASNKRPGMTSMLADAAAGSFDIVLAEALDRDRAQPGGHRDDLSASRVCRRPDRDPFGRTCERAAHRPEGYDGRAVPEGPRREDPSRSARHRLARPDPRRALLRLRRRA